MDGKGTGRGPVIRAAVFLVLTAALQGGGESLTPSTPIVRALKGGEAHVYQVGVTTGDFLYVVVDQRGIDVSVTVGDSGGTLASADNPSGGFGPEPVAVIATRSGVHRIEVRALSVNALPGSYEISVAALRPATSDDREHVAALRAFAEGQRLRGHNTGESRLQAIEQYQKALAFFRSSDDRFNEVLTAYRIAFVHASSGDFRKTLAALNEVLPLVSTLDEPNMVATTLNLAGGAYDVLGEPDKALEYYGNALSQFRAVGNRVSEAAALNNIGTIYLDTAAWQQSLDYYAQALRISEAIGDAARQAAILHNIGSIELRLGDLEKSLDAYQRALRLHRATGDKAGQADTTTSIASAYVRLGQTSVAIDLFEQARSLRTDVGDPRGRAMTLLGLGNAYAAVGDLAKSAQQYDDALQLYRAGNDRRQAAITLLRLAGIRTRQQQPAQAIDLFRESIGVLHGLGDNAYESQALQGLARAQLTLGNLDEARDAIAQALSRLERARSSVVSQELRASYLASEHEAYLLSIDVAMRLHRQDPSAGHAVAALEASERAHARGLLEMLTEARVDIRRGVDPTLIDKEQQLAQEINAKAERLMSLPASAAGQAHADAFNKEITELESEYEQVRSSIRQSSPAFAAIVQPQPLAATAIQQLLDDDTVLVEYALGRERSHAWAVTPSSVRGYELAPQGTIEQAARSLYTLVTARSTSRPGESARERQERVARADREMPGSIRELSRLVLLPLAQDLGHKRIVVVADGALQYVPFAMLTLSGTAAYRPLITDAEVVNAPSASAIAVQRLALAGRTPAPKGVAIVADPVFSARDERFKGVATTLAPDPTVASPTTRLLEHFAEVSGTPGSHTIPRLPFTSQEARAIESVAGPLGHMTALGFNASRTTAMSPDLASYRYVHFATHGYLDTDRPDLSALVLSTIDEHGRPQEGFLRAHDIYNLNLPAELVVLSACETGLGKEIKGEGLVGLTRGFMYAGAARVAVSLWSVSDKATADLMRSFYTAMLRRGERPAAALRSAQLEMLKQKAWSSPYYWAPFVLQGEWK